MCGLKFQLNPAEFRNAAPSTFVMLIKYLPHCLGCFSGEAKAFLETQPSFHSLSLSLSPSEGSIPALLEKNGPFIGTYHLFLDCPGWIAHVHPTSLPSKEVRAVCVHFGIECLDTLWAD